MTTLSANLGFLWADLPLLARIDAAAKAGFPAIELHWPYDVPAREVRAACMGHGLRLMGLNTPVGDAAKGEFGLGALPRREADFAAAMRQSIDYAVEAGAGAIHVMAGVTAGLDAASCRETFIANLARFAPEAASHGLTLLLEAINRRDKPGYFYSRQDEAAEIIEAVGAPNIRLMFDVYHCGVAEGDITKKLERLLPLIGHVQIAAVPSRAEPDEGEVDFRHIFATLARLGWEQPIGCEYKPRAGTDAGLVWREMLGAA
jgi:hydroxypyruvate isomerase